MSLFLIRNELKNLLDSKDIKIEKPKIIASYGTDNDQKNIYFDNYNEEKLEYIVTNKKNVLVDINFWNYNYCHKNNINNKDRKKLLKYIDIVEIDENNFYLGSMLNLINMNQILLNTFKITEFDKFCDYLNLVNIDKFFTCNYLIDQNLKLPLYKNYIYLLKNLFRDTNIIKLIFRQLDVFTASEIYNHFYDYDFGNIDETGFYIFNSKIENKDKLLYCLTFLEIYNKIIDQYEVSYIELKNFRPNMAYYLYNIDIEEEYNSLYFDVIRLFVLKGGSKKVIIMDNQVINKKMEEKYNIIKNILNY